MYPGGFVWGNVRYSVVVLLVDVNYPMEAVLKWLCEQVLEFDFGCTPGVGGVVVWRGVGDH